MKRKQTPAPKTMTTPGMRRVSVHYYAQLRVARGRPAETLKTDARTVRELFERIGRRHPFPLPAERLRVAVNDKLAGWTQPLRDGDVVVFLPPGAGG